MLKKNNRESRNKQTSNQRCLRGKEWTLTWGSEKSMPPSMNCKLIFKTTTESICPKDWKPTWEGTLFRNASCLSSYLCLESCLRLTQSELRSDCTASVITERVIDTVLKAEMRHSGTLKVFHSLGCILRDRGPLTVPSSRMTDTVSVKAENTGAMNQRHKN